MAAEFSSRAPGFPAADLSSNTTIRYAKRAGLSLVFAGTLIGSLFSTSPASAQTAMQTYVEAMQPGINYGNTYDAAPNETSWGNAAITQAYANALVAKGYKSIRMTVTWRDHIGPAPAYTIDPAWMTKIRQAVDISLNAGLYVVLNAHHDSGWVSDYGWDPVGVKAKFDALWLQIATQFKDYPGTLSFESINEPGFRGTNGNDLPDAQMATRLDELNANFVHLVRASGGGNATRPLVLPTIYTRSDQPMLDSLKNTITTLNDPNLIATIHYYGWYPFSVNLGGYTKFDETSIYWVHTPLDAAHDTFVADGIPVIVGEFSVLSGSWIQRGEQLKYHEYVQAYGRSKGMTMMLWDTGGIFDRNTNDWRNPDLGNIMMHAVTGRAITAESDLLFVDAAAPAGETVVDMHLNGNTLVGVEDNGTMLTPLTDYTVSGDTLTLKAHVLAKYATGAFGEKATLKLHADSGPAWKIFVRYASTPVPGSVTTTTKAAFSLPVAFNGDLLATMKSVHENGSNAGPTNWTSFQQFGSDFKPNYANNTIEFTANFFRDTPPGLVNLELHFWSGKVLRYQINIVERSSEGGTEFVIYEDAIPGGWHTWNSWMPYDLKSTAEVHSGSNAISVTPTGWGGLTIQNGWGAAVDTSAFRTLMFWVHGGPTGGQSIGLHLIFGDDWNSSAWIGLPPLEANTWQKIEIPLNALNAEGRSNITGVSFRHFRGENGPTFYLDQIYLTTAKTTTVMDLYGTPAPVITSSTVAYGDFGVPFSYTVAAVNNPVSFSATGLPAGLTLDASTGVISGTPAAAGHYVVTLGATNAVGTNTQTLLLEIAPSPVTFSLPGGGSFSAAIVATYDGGPLPVEITTTPAGIPVTITYNGSTKVPSLPGTYNVVVTSADPNHVGNAQGTLVINVTALVRHAPTINGALDGSLQLLSGETFAVNGSGEVYGDLLVPGTPAVQLNGTPAFGGVVDAAGATAPADYGITLNGSALVRYVMRRVDPIAMPVVTAPATPAGTRDVTLNKTDESAGDFATVRNLTLNGNAGTVTVPAGVYGSLTANGNSTLVLGVAGASEPAVYELQGLTLNGSASVQVVGPVTLKLAQGTSLNGTVGSAEHPEWLQLLIRSGDLTLNGNAKLHGIVTAPSSSVTINGELHGRVSADRLTINGSGLLEDSDL